MQFAKFICGNKKVLYFLLCMISWHSVGIAAEYYASPTGTATWGDSTSISTPCSLQTGGANAVAGDTVYLRGGTYTLPFRDASGSNYWRVGFYPSNSGASGNPITFKAYSDEIPIFDNSANAGQANTVISYGTLNTANTDYIVFDGLKTTAVASTGGHGIGATLKRTTGSIIRNAEIIGIDTGTSNNSSIRVEDGSYCTIENNTLHGSHQLGDPHHNSAAFMLYDSDHITVQNNTIYDADCALFDKQGGTYNTYRLNYIYNCDMGFQHSSSPKHTGNIEVYQNIFRNIDQWAFQIAATDTDPVNGILFYNNVVYDVGDGAELGIDSGVDDAEIFNNIFYTTNRAVFSYTGAAIFINYNDYYSVSNFVNNSTTYSLLSSWQTATGWDQNPNTNKPNFVNPGGTSSEDYKRTSYPQDGRGGSYPFVRGAYITGNEVIGYSSDGGEPPPDIEKPQDFQREPSQ